MKNTNKKTILIIAGLFLGFSGIIFYSDANRQASAADLEQRIISVDHYLENKFLEMEHGKIPIGEATDEAEDFTQKILDEMEIIDDNLGQEISAGNKLVWLPEQCECKRCNSNMETSSICCACCGENQEGCSPKYCCNWCKCVCSGNVCPFGDIENQVNIIQDADEKIIKSSQRINDLILAENPLPCDPDRWEILNKLLNSRYKMERCVQGFETTLKTTRAEINLLSCRTALNQIETKSHGLVLLGFFENHISDYPYCYPYTANTNIRAGCKINRDSDDDCVVPIQEYMDNYFCAGDYLEIGGEGGNKEGDEAPVCYDEEPPEIPPENILGQIWTYEIHSTYYCCSNENIASCVKMDYLDVDIRCCKKYYGANVIDAKCIHTEITNVGGNIRIHKQWNCLGE